MRIMRYNNIFISRQRLCSSMSDLKLVNVIFRHGDRIPLMGECYPKDPYRDMDYYPFIEGDLTLSGKKQLYDIGRALRCRYGTFLGKYYDKFAEVVSTDTPRTKMGAMLVCAGLFPPAQDERFDPDMPWQPIPFSYTPYNEDNLLVDPLSRLSTVFTQEYKAILETDYHKELLKKYKDTLDIISEHTGITNISIYSIFSLQFCLHFEEKFKLSLPDWTSTLYPEIICTIAAEEYILETLTDSMLQQTAGTLVQKLIKDCEESICEKSSKKIILYSAHETTIAYHLRALRIFEPHIPPTASYVIWELLKTDQGYGIQVFYQDYQSRDPRLMVLPNCDAICPFECLKEMTKNSIPTATCGRAHADPKEYVH